MTSKKRNPTIYKPYKLPLSDDVLHHFGLHEGLIIPRAKGDEGIDAWVVSEMIACAGNPDGCTQDRVHELLNYGIPPWKMNIEWKDPGDPSEAENAFLSAVNHGNAAFIRSAMAWGYSPFSMTSFKEVCLEVYSDNYVTHPGTLVEYVASRDWSQSRKPKPIPNLDQVADALLYGLTPEQSELVLRLGLITAIRCQNVEGVRHFLTRGAKPNIQPRVLKKEVANSAYSFRHDINNPPSQTIYAAAEQFLKKRRSHVDPIKETFDSCALNSKTLSPVGAQILHLLISYGASFDSILKTAGPDDVYASWITELQPWKEERELKALSMSMRKPTPPSDGVSLPVEDTKHAPLSATVSSTSPTPVVRSPTYRRV